MKTIVLIAICLCGFTTQAQIFDNYRVIGDPVEFSLVQTADLDTNGWMDIVAIDTAGYLYVYLNDSLTFTSPPVFNIGASPKVLVVDDVTGNGSIDLLVGIDSEIIVYEGNSAGGVSYWNSFLVSGTLNEVAYGDVDNDGNKDVVVSSFCDGLIQILYGPDYIDKIDYADFIPVSGHNDIEIGKVGSIIVPNHLYFMNGQDVGFSVREYSVNPSRVMSLVETYTLSSSLPYSFCSSIDLSDLGANGVLDIIGAHGENEPDSYLALWEQNSPSATLIPVPGIPSGVKTADFNNNPSDGEEIFMVHAGQDSVSVVEGGVVTTYWAPVPNTPHDEAVSVVDMNNDGFPDAVMPAKNQGILITYNNAVDSLLSVQESVPFVENIVVYPNPFVDEINFSKAISGEMVIFSIDGACVARKTLHEETQFQLSDLKKGSYFLLLDGIFVTKIIKTE